MKITDFLHRESIVANLTARTRDEVLEELASAIARREGVAYEDVLRVLTERERLGSTGIGDGVAIPHGTLGSVNHLVALFARSLEGVAFDAVDGRPSHLFFVQLAPDSNVSLQALARVARLLRKAEFRAALLAAADVEALYQVIMAEDARL